MPSVFVAGEPRELVSSGAYITSNSPANRDDMFSRVSFQADGSIIYHTRPWLQALAEGCLALTSNVAGGLANNRVPVLLTDADGTTPILRLFSGATLNASGTLQRWNGGDWLDIDTAVVNLGVVRMAFHWKIHASTGYFRWYIAGNLAGEYTGDTTDSGAATVGRAAFHPPQNNANHFVSEIIVADEDCSEWRLRTLSLTDNGTYQEQASGDYTDIDEVNISDADLMSLASAGDRFSGTVGTLPSGISGMVTESVWVHASALVDGGGPQNLELGVRYDSSDSYGSPHALTGMFSGYYSRIEDRPGESRPPTLAELGDYEIIARAAS